MHWGLRHELRQEATTARRDSGSPIGTTPDPASRRYARRLFANAYYLTWGGPGESALPVYEVTLGLALRGLHPLGKGWNLLRAAEGPSRPGRICAGGPIAVGSGESSIPTACA